MIFTVQLTMMSCVVLLLLVLLTSNLVKGSNYSPEQVFYNQHSRTTNAAVTNNAKPSQSAFVRFIIGKHRLPPNIIKITERVAVKVPYAQLIPVPHNVPYPFPVPVARPFPVEVPQIINLNQDTPTQAPETLTEFSRTYDQPANTFNDAPIATPTTYNNNDDNNNYQNYGPEISPYLLPPP